MTRLGAKSLAALLLVSVATSAVAAADDDPAIPAASYPMLVPHAQLAEGFVPPGWKLESKLTGDLNGDGRDDVVLVLRGADPRNIIEIGGQKNYDTNPRILAVAFAGTADGYDLVLENHTLISRTTEPSAQDPLDANGVQEGGIEITKRTIKVTLGYFSGIMGRKTYTFRYRDKRFGLIGYDSIDVERFSGAMAQVSVNYLTRKMNLTRGNISSDTDKVTRKTLRPGQLLTMEQIGDGLDFSPSQK